MTINTNGNSCVAGKRAFFALAAAVLIPVGVFGAYPAVAWAQQQGDNGQEKSPQRQPPAPVPQKTNPPLQVPLPRSGAVVSGSYQQTVNVSALGSPKPSTGERLNLSSAPRFGGSIDGRIEYYTDGSYNADPPGQLLRNINEPKFELQVMYNRAIMGPLGVTVGGLHHENFRFPDQYFWAIAGLTYSKYVARGVQLSGAALGEYRTNGSRERPFYDLSSTAEWDFLPAWNVQANIHRYENLGQFDPKPTQKLELEFAVNRAVGHKQTVGVSFFRHTQYNGPNDQFSFLKLKYGVAF